MNISRKVKFAVAGALLLLGAFNSNVFAMHQQIKSTTTHSSYAPHYHTADGTAVLKTGTTAK